MRILILGAGAIGGYFGGRLIEAGVDVTFLVRQPRAGQLARDGLVIDSPFGEFKQHVVAITSCADIKPPDIIVLTCKAYALEQALNAVAPCIAPQTVILPLLNGLAHFEIIEQRFPDTVVWGGVAHIGVTLNPDGVIKHLNTDHTLMFGPRDGTAQALADELLGNCSPASVNARLSLNIVQDLWDKLVFLATLAGSTCLMRASIGTILETTYGQELILALLNECGTIATAEGFAPDGAQIERYKQQLTEPGSPATSSMLRDIQSAAPTEAEHIIGDMVSRAAQHRISTPVLKIVYTHLQAYQARHVMAP